MMPLVFLLVAWRSPEVRDSVLIARVQSTSSRRVDSTLTDEPIGRWLTHTVGPRVRLRWSVDDCGEGASAGDSTFLCVTAEAELGLRRRLTVSFAIAPQTTGAPVLWWAEVDGAGPSRSTARLREVVSLVRSAAAKPAPH